MYTYKRLKTSKPVLTILLITLALIAWASLGYAVKPDKPGKPDRSGQNYPHDLPVAVSFRDDPGDQVQSDSLGPYISGEPYIWAILGRRFGAFGLKTETRNNPKTVARTVSLDFSHQVDHGLFSLPIEFNEALPPEKVFIRTARPDETEDRYLYDLRAMDVGSPMSVPLLIRFSFDEPLDVEDNWYVSFGDVTTGDGWLDSNIDGSSGTPVTVTRLSGDDPDTPEEEGEWEIKTPDKSEACLHSVNRNGDTPVKYYGDYNMSFGLTITALASQAAPPASNLPSGLTSTWGRIKTDRD